MTVPADLTVPALVVGTVSHARRSPVSRRFQHRHYQWLVDLDRLPRYRWPLRLVSRFDPRDHLDEGRLGGGIRGDLARFLAARGVELADDDRVLMLAHARVLGHTFDPLTVFWCVDREGRRRAVVLEVHNTYGERHAYLLDLDEEGRGSVDKAFYVSPFNDVSGRYDVRVGLDRERVGVSIRLVREGGPVFTAASTGVLVPATPANLRRTAVRHLLMTQRVSLLIRWHGIRLWLTRLPVHPRSPHPQEAVR